MQHPLQDAEKEIIKWLRQEQMKKYSERRNKWLAGDLI
jgi:hypothetical protein